MMSECYYKDVILNGAKGLWRTRVYVRRVLLAWGGTPPAAGRGSNCSAEALRLRSGQALVEYVVIGGMLLATVAILMVFLGTFREYGNRVLDLVGSEYP